MNYKTNISKKDKEVLKQAIEICQNTAVSSFPDDAAIADIDFSDAFKKKMSKLIRLRQKSYYPFIKTTGRRLAFAALCLFMIISATVMSVKALREPVFRFLIEVFDEFSMIMPDPQFSDTSINASDIEAFKFTYLPDGYTQTDISVNRSYICIEYSDNYGNPLKLIQCKNSQIHINNKDIASETVSINEFCGIYFKSNNIGFLVFSDGIYTFFISGPFDKAELIKIAESLKPVN